VPKYKECKFVKIGVAVQISAVPTGSEELFPIRQINAIVRYTTTLQYPEGTPLDQVPHTKMEILQLTGVSIEM
jgi:hypothetical protein